MSATSSPEVTLLVEQAIYGEVKGGHGLRAASGDRFLATELAPRLDLPDTAPPGADWSPFVSGFPYGDRYVFTRTFRDPNATRAGMVVSHALIAPLNAVITIADLRPIFGEMIIAPTNPEYVTTLSVASSSSATPVGPELSATAKALTSSGITGPVVIVGHEKFESIVVSLWGQLWPALRRTFSFRLSFGPGDLIDDPRPALVCTPASLTGRWREHRLVDRYVNGESSLASKALSGDSAGDTLRTFADTIAAEITTFGDLGLLEHAHRFTELEPGLIANSIAAIRLLERLSPSPNQGVEGKSRLLNHFILQLDSAAPDDLLLLRNIQLSGFVRTEQAWTAVTERVSNLLFLLNSDTVLSAVVADSLTTVKASKEWRRAVLAGLAVAIGRSAEEFAMVLWRWAETRTELTEKLWGHLGLHKEFEDRLVRAAPDSLSNAAARPVLTYAAHYGLYRLHGSAAAAAYTAIEAARLQLRVESAPSTAGLALAIRRASPEQVVTCAVVIDDPRLIQLAAEAVAKSPELLADTDMSIDVSRALWLKALEISLDTWRGPSDPYAAFYRILQDFLDGLEPPMQLISRLSTTPLGAINAFPRRAELWMKLAPPVKDCLLRTTALKWLEEAEVGRPLSYAEPELVNEILGLQELDTILDRLASGHIGYAVQIIFALDQFNEPRFRRWLHKATARTNPMPKADAEAIGRLVLERTWRGVVRDLMGLLHAGRKDVKPALRAAISLVSVFHRFFYRVSDVTPEEKWIAFADLAAELYPTGPDHDGLWERAGGQNADLEAAGNGRLRWRQALARTRHGGGCQLEALLREMLNDYPGNAELRHIGSDREFNSRR